jgi:3-hydroxybutyrate dehydrogenase
VAGLAQTIVGVTGSTRGLGRSIAEAFLGAGSSVVVNGRDAAAGEDFLAEATAGPRLVFHQGDVTEQPTVEALVDLAVDRFGRLDVLVLNAGGTEGEATLAELGDAEWRRVIDLNLSHVFWGMRRALRHMIPRRSGRIIVISAVEGKLPRAGASAYVAAKHGVTGLVKSVAHEVGPIGITVNAILPGVLATSASNGRTGGAAALLERSKIGRPNTAGEVASAALMLASPAMTSVTGCMFPVDGGTMPY